MAQQEMPHTLDELRELVGEDGVHELTDKLRGTYVERLNKMQDAFDAKPKEKRTAKDYVELASFLSEASNVCNSQQDMVRECEDLIKEAKTLDPYSAELSLLIAKRARDSGTPQRAIVALERVIAEKGDTLDLSDRLLMQLELAINSRLLKQVAQGKTHLVELRRIMPAALPNVTHIQIESEEVLNAAASGEPVEKSFEALLAKCIKEENAQEGGRLIRFVLDHLVPLHDVPLPAILTKVKAHAPYASMAVVIAEKRREGEQAAAELQAKREKRRMIFTMSAVVAVFGFLFYNYFLLPNQQASKQGRREL